MVEEPEVNEVVARSRGLTHEEYKRACNTIGRTPTYAEMGVIAAMWSEHCSYKSSRVHLKRLPTTGPRVIQGPGENAGVVDIGDGFCVVFKMESHNHPSFIEPYQGAATGVGGILRDVFTMGARPVAVLNSLRFGEASHPRTRALVAGVVAGIAGYGNAFGVPTVGGEVTFDSAYNTNILVNAFALGLARTDRIFYGRATGVGNSLLYVGARTGRDGVHGATMASAEFDSDKATQRPTVQVGDPFLGKLLLEACLEIFSQDLLEGVQDMGAAGLTSSSVEMAGRAGNGVDIDLDRVPRRVRSMKAYELLLSESQERMLMVARPGCEDRVLEICRRWDLDAVVIGTVTTTNRFVVRQTPGYDPLDSSQPRPTQKPAVVVDLPIEMLTDDAPRYDRPTGIDPHAESRRAYELPEGKFEPLHDLLDLLGSPNVGSRAWIYRQFDHIVRVGSVVRPGDADAAVVRLFCEGPQGNKEKFIALSVDCNARFCALDARNGGAMAVAEACRNLVCVGAQPIALTDCLNFGSPERPEVMASLRDAIDGIRDASLALNAPIVSGNVSLYNETLVGGISHAILPTPTIGAVGLLEKISDRLTMSFKHPSDQIVLLGPWTEDGLGGSEWLNRKTGRVCGVPPSLDLEAETRLQSMVLACARRGLLSSAHDCAEGGLLVAVAESCIAGNLGARIELPHERIVSAATLFGEGPSRVVVSCSVGQAALVLELAREMNVPSLLLGTVEVDSFIVAGVLQTSVLELTERHTAALETVVGEVPMT